MGGERGRGEREGREGGERGRGEWEGREEEREGGRQAMKERVNKGERKRRWRDGGNRN